MGRNESNGWVGDDAAEGQRGSGRCWKDVEMRMLAVGADIRVQAVGGGVGYNHRSMPVQLLI